MSTKSSITLILGGARSGKSSHAQSLAEATGKPVTFLATAQALDEEMSTRIQKHRAERPAGWKTLEVPCAIASPVSQIKSDVVILDCVTLLVSNLLMQFVREDVVEELPFMLAVQEEIESLITTIHQQKQDWFIISNEVGLGLVPPYQMGRVYRDALGSANQRLARDADRVLFMVAGLPMVVK
jgi:adenosylcobinamide kinase/adenosylcobinamide-phosphate guanylyltransferase